MYMMNSMLKLEMKTGICRIDWAILQRVFFGVKSVKGSFWNEIFSYKGIQFSQILLYSFTASTRSWKQATYLKQHVSELCPLIFIENTE
jgi:hypothetical protein